MALSAYERRREENRAMNQKLLEEMDLLNLQQSLFEQKEKAKKRRPSKKRKEPPPEADYQEEEEPVKAPRRDETDTPANGCRRSARNAGRKIDYKAELVQSMRDPDALLTARKSKSGPHGRPSGSKRIHD
jgi:E3 ubiquitin-protein ligase UHRF1